MDKSTFTQNPTDAARLSSPATAAMSGDQPAGAAHWSAGDSARDTLSRARHVVQDHPIQAVALSLLAGYAIARLLGMRSWRG